MNYFFSDDLLKRFAEAAKRCLHLGDIDQCFADAHITKNMTYPGGSSGAFGIFMAYAHGVEQGYMRDVVRLADALSNVLRFLEEHGYLHERDQLLEGAGENGFVWQQGRLDFLVTNQGRVRSDNVAGILHHGLRFRSRAEVLVCDALSKEGVPFAPLPVLLKGDDTWARIEPDFLLLLHEKLCVLEVNGPHHEGISALKEQERIKFLTRRSAEPCYIDAPVDVTSATQLVRDGLKFLSDRLG